MKDMNKLYTILIAKAGYGSIFKVGDRVELIEIVGPSKSMPGMTVVDVKANDGKIYGMFLEDFEFEQVVAVELLCECGSEKTRAFGHSSWCPKFQVI
jgi:hypothetical protein